MRKITKFTQNAQKIIAYILLALVGAFAFFSILGVILSVQGCAPRSATMCLKNNAWVKCPPNTPAGTILKAKR